MEQCHHNSRHRRHSHTLRHGRGHEHCAAVLSCQTGPVKRWLWALLFSATTVFAAGPFIEDGGVVVFEAEDFDAQVLHGSAYAWGLSSSVTGFSGAGYMEAAPNNGTNISTSWVNSSPELQFSVNFTNAGTHYVWIRGYGTSSSDNSVHAGVDGTTNTAAAITLSQFGAWLWTTNRQDIAGTPTITVGTTGIHTFNLWMREDGMRVDNVLLTINP